jgi:hypothetical protein
VEKSEAGKSLLRSVHFRIMAALIHSDLPGLKLLSKGKVRDIYATSSPDHLLFVASDRISAYDVVLQNVRTPSAAYELLI